MGLFYSIAKGRKEEDQEGKENAQKDSPHTSGRGEKQGSSQATKCKRKEVKPGS